MGLANTLYSKLMIRNRAAEQKMPPEVRENIPANGVKQVSALALQSSGDQLVNASTVLPWLFATLGVPSALTGFLVPIRESGSMLPQAALTPLVMKIEHRKWVFTAGSAVQAAAVGAMAVIGATMSGLAAGIAILIALAVFSLGRCLCSISSKDVQGKTIPKGERGQINGLSTTASGIVAITVGLAIRIFGSEDLSAAAIVWLFVAAAVLWIGVAVIYATVREPASEVATDKRANNETGESKGWIRDSWELLRDDKPFRNFVGVRSLLLVSSLSPAFLVTLSIQTGASGLAGLGGFIIASGLAQMLGGRIFGRFADRSSSRLMSIGAGVASGIIIVTVIITLIPGFSGNGWLVNIVFVLAYFGITLMHTGVRVGRKTYLVDMADGDLRTKYTAVSNSTMGVVLLIVGAISSALATIHIVWALLFLAIMGIFGVVAGARLPDVSAK